MKVIHELLDQLDELKAKTFSAQPITSGAEIHGMTVSANAMSAILFAKHVLGEACEFKVHTHSLAYNTQLVASQTQTRLSSTFLDLRCAT